MESIFIIFATIIVIIIMILIVYYIRPEIILYIPEIAELHKSASNVVKLVDDNKNLNSKLKSADIELAAKITEMSSIQDKFNSELAIANNELAAKIAELNNIQAKYKTLNKSTIKLIDVELDQATQLLIASIQKSINNIIGISPEAKTSFTKLYFSLIDLGLAARSQLCDSKEKIISNIDLIISQIPQEVLNGMCIPKTYTGSYIERVMNDKLYASVDQSQPIISTNSIRVIGGKSGSAVVVRPLYDANTISIVAKVATDATAYFNTFIGHFCKAGIFDTLKARNMFVNELQANCP